MVKESLDSFTFIVVLGNFLKAKCEVRRMKNVGSMLVSRLIQLVFIIFVLSFVTFVLMKVAPGDPIRSVLKVDDVISTTGDEQRVREELGFDEPILSQYGSWLLGVMRLDLGESILAKKPVFDLLMSRLPATFSLAAGGMIVLFFISVPLGILGAIYEGRWPDYISRGFALLGASMPSFWLGLLFMYLFSYKLGLLPVMGKGTLAHFVLPSVTLGIVMAPMYIRLLRERLVATLQSPYIESAKARGLSSKRVLLFHALRGSFIPFVTMFGLSVGSLLGGVMVIEILFSWPGMGELMVDSVMNRDYPLIQGYILLIGCFVVITNLIVDFLYQWLNPQIRSGKEAGSWQQQQ